MASLLTAIHPATDGNILTTEGCFSSAADERKKKLAVTRQFVISTAHAAVSFRPVDDERAGYGTGILDVPSVLPDVSQLRLIELLSRDDSVLQHAVQRILNESDAHDIVAGFNSAI